MLASILNIQVYRIAQNRFDGRLTGVCSAKLDKLILGPLLTQGRASERAVGKEKGPDFSGPEKGNEKTITRNNIIAEISCLLGH